MQKILTLWVLHFKEWGQINKTKDLNYLRVQLDKEDRECGPGTDCIIKVVVVGFIEKAFEQIRGKRRRSASQLRGCLATDLFKNSTEARVLECKEDTGEIAQVKRLQVEDRTDQITQDLEGHFKIWL